MRLRRLLLILLCFVSVSVFPQGKEADTEALGRALEYFQSQKYHEALLIFQRLDQSYKLNARYKAYIGLCYYYDWDYKKATEYFDTFLPKLDMLAPGSGRSTIMRTGKATSSWATTTRRSSSSSLRSPFATTATRATVGFGSASAITFSSSRPWPRVASS